MEASSQLPQKSLVLQVAWEGDFNSQGDVEGYMLARNSVVSKWEKKRGRQRPKSADLRDLAFLFLFPEDAGKCLLPPWDL